MAEDFHDKTEQPTPKKLADARKKGLVAKSNDVTIAFMLLGTMLIFFFFSAYMYHQLEYLCFSILNNLNYRYASLDILSWHLKQGLNHFFWMLFPLLAGCIFIAFAANIIQVGVIYSLDPLKPRWKKLNFFNLSNYERNFGLPAWVRLIFGLLRLNLVLALSYLVMSHNALYTFSMWKGTPRDILLFIFHETLTLGTACSISYILTGVLDYLFQRWRFYRQMRMSVREIKEEIKQLEGDSSIKSKIRSIMRGLAETSLMHVVPKADVVVAQGERFVVAIQYDPEHMKAPLCVCKGSFKRGAQIRRLAANHGVPIVENPYLAESMYRLVESGIPISPAFYHQVADVLAKIQN